MNGTGFNINAQISFALSMKIDNFMFLNSISEISNLFSSKNEEKLLYFYVLFLRNQRKRYFKMSINIKM